jgi:type I restriction enzyme S subunit
LGYTDKWNTKENTITISEGGNSCGYINFIKSNFWSGGHCYSLLEIKNFLDKDFLYYALKGRESLVMDLRVGSGLPNIQQKAIKAFEFIYPKNKLEQEKIAKILSKIDNAISQTEVIIAKHNRIKTGLMQDLLTKGIDDKGNIRSEETHEFIKSGSFNYPKDWQLTTIEKCLISIEQGWSPNCEGDPASMNEWGILKTTSVTWKGYDENQNKRMPGKLSPKIHYEVKNGDVLITRGGPNSRVGVVSYVSETRDKLIFSDKIYRLIPKNIVLNKYLALALSSEFTQRHLSNFKTGMAESQTNISQKIVQALNILLPSIVEQKRIIETLNSSENVIDSLLIDLSKLKSIKTGLMQDLLSGKKRVQI